MKHHQWLSTLRLRHKMPGSMHRCRSKQYFGGAKDSLPEILPISPMHLWDKHYPVGTLFSSTKLPETCTVNRRFGTWNLVLDNPTETKRSAVQEHCQKAAVSVFLSICLTVSRFSILHSSCCRQQWTPDLAEVGLKLLPSLKTLKWYMWHGSLYLYYDYAASLTTLLHKYTICKKI